MLVQHENAYLMYRCIYTDAYGFAREFSSRASPQTQPEMIVTASEGQENVQPCANLPRVVVYTTSTPIDLLTKSSIRRLFQLLDILGIVYNVVDLAETPSRKREMLEASNGRSTLPQLHVDGKLIGDLSKVEEMHDFGVRYPRSSLSRKPIHDTNLQLVQPCLAA